jgi:glycosyltransferase involved in cell wall biosynthesis
MLTRAVHSALRQTYAEIEVIVVDDGSTDDTEGTLSRCGLLSDPRMRYAKIPHAGVSVARNVGLSMARGEFIAFLDSDDTWAPTKLERSLAALEEDANLVYTDAAVVAEAGRRTVRYSTLVTPHTGEVLTSLLRANFVCLSTVVVRKKALVACGSFAGVFRSCEDYDLWLRLAARGKFSYLDEPLCNYCRHVESISGSNVLGNYWRIAWMRLARCEYLSRGARVRLILRIVARLPRALGAAALELSQHKQAPADLINR